LFAFTSFALCLLSLDDPAALERVGRLDHAAIREASGIVKSRRHPGIFWVHNDSGNLPALFAVRRDGSLVREYAVSALNIDWEDIATDSSGHLYIGDIGNNGLRLPVRAIHRIDEPDPSRATEQPLEVTLSTHYRFPSVGERFDAEALFLWKGQAVVVAKTHDGREAELFAIPLEPPAPLLRPALPRKLGRLPGFTEPVTGANLSSDGRRLAVCANSVTRVYEPAPQDEWKMIGGARYAADEVEAVCWDGDDLILASERREIYRIPRTTWLAKKAPPATDGRKP
jgi:hypothetical protein